MVEISDRLLCLFTAEVDSEGDSYTISIPRREVENGQIDSGDSYQVALLDQESGDRSQEAIASPAKSVYSDESPAGKPPVEEGEIIDVEIESIGDKGDGIAKVGPGYVVIIPETEVGERVRARITETKDSVGFAEVVKRHTPNTHSD